MDIKDYESLSRSILAERLGAKVLSIKYLGGGSFGRVFLAEIDKEPYKVVHKLYLVEGMQTDEAADLALLRGANAVKVPDVYFTTAKAAGDKADSLCMEFINGVDCFTHFSFLFASRKKKMAFAEDVTDAVIALHSRKSDKFGYARKPEYDSWQSFYRRFVGDIIGKARTLAAEGKIKKRILATAELAYSNFDKVFDEDIPFAVLSHGDGNVMNMLADPKTFKLIAFIDPWNALYCDPDYDLYQLGTLSGNLFRLRAAYKRKAPTSPKCDLKVAYYGVFTELNCYVKTGRYTGVIMHSALRAFRRQARKYGLK